VAEVCQLHRAGTGRRAAWPQCRPVTAMAGNRSRTAPETQTAHAKAESNRFGTVLARSADFGRSLRRLAVARWA
jgi:hypothetical protein